MNIKKILTYGLLIVAFSYILTGCGDSKETNQTKNSVDITLEQVKEANRTENLLAHHDSFQLHMKDKSAQWTYYADKDLVYYEDDAMYEITTDTTVFGKYSRFVSGSLFVEDEMDAEWKDNLFFDDIYADSEEMVECIKDGDTLLFTTKVPTEAYAKLVGHTGKDSYVLLEYTLDAKTYAIREFTETVMHPNDTTTISLTATVEYNTTRPQKANDLYSHTTQKDNLRTVTVVVAPDTVEEKAYSVQVPVGDDVEIHLPDKYKKMYSDRACTQDLPATENLSADVTYYIPGTAK